jgi:hypothetical protein
MSRRNRTQIGRLVKNIIGAVHPVVLVRLRG